MPDKPILQWLYLNSRAVLSDRPILLLDEASSALDEHTEQRLFNNLQAMVDKTCLIISHRSAAREICDQVINLGTQAVTIQRG